MNGQLLTYSVRMRTSTLSTTSPHNGEHFTLQFEVHEMVIQHAPVVEAEVTWSVYDQITVKNRSKLYNYIDMVYNL